jgi:hypothetical protein
MAKNKKIKMSILVPKELKIEMAKIRIDWSEIACHAFRNKLDEIVAKNRYQTDMDLRVHIIENLWKLEQKKIF